MNVSNMQDYLTATPITVGQLSSILFEARPELALHQHNDVIRGIQGHYSLNPKWLTYLTLGYVGKTETHDKTKMVKVSEPYQEVQLMMLASFKYDELSITPAKTDDLIKRSYELFLDSCKADPKK